MRLVLPALGLLLLALRPAAASEIKILEPADKSVLHGSVKIRLTTQNAPGELFLANPDIQVKDENGNVLSTFRPVRDPQTGICSANLDTMTLRDGLYLVSFTYKTQVGEGVTETSEELNLGVRNGKQRAAKFTVVLPDKPFSTDDSCDVTVRVFDQNGRRMPSARVQFKVDKGESNTPAEISDSHGEALATLYSDDPQTLTLTITVEGLPPVTRTVRFVEPATP